MAGDGNELAEPLTEEPFKLLVQSIVDYAIYMLDPTGMRDELERRRRADQGLPDRRDRRQAFLDLLHRRRTARPACRSRCSKPPGAKASSRAKAGASARTARASGRASSSTASTTRTAKLIGFAKITRDMTESAAAQQALLEAEQRFRILVQGVTDYAIFMLSPDGYVTNWNEGARRIKGYGPKKSSVRPFPQFLHARGFEAGVPMRGLKIARERGVLKRRDGGSAKTAPVSGRTS